MARSTSVTVANKGYICAPLVQHLQEMRVLIYPDDCAR